MFTAKEVDEMLLTQKAAFIDQLFRSKQKHLLEKEYGISPRTGARYRRLIHLIPELAEMVDDNMLPMLSGVALSYLDAEEQIMVFKALVMMNVLLIPSVANKLKNMKGRLSLELVREILKECKVDYVPQAAFKFSIRPDSYGKYFCGMDTEEAEKKIERILDSWFKEHAQEERLILVRKLYSSIVENNKELGSI